MKKYELSISPDYVPTWTTTDAVRELFQNALDQQTLIPDNTMFFTYEDNLLRIGNKQSTLDIQSLLLGSSTKTHDEGTIGQFGEGYKIATLVLLRNNKTITFYNYGNREVWKPRFVNSRRYNGAKILTFFIDKSYFWESTPDNHLTIEIQGVTESEYDTIVNSNLHLQHLGESDFIPSSRGRILTLNEHLGKVYINGLYVCTCKDYDYGYDFKPQFLKLDRDRKLVSDFDLQWATSMMWGEASQSRPEINDEIIDRVRCNSRDMTYLSSNTQLKNQAYESFKSQYGATAVPVSTQEEYDQYKHCTPVIVNASYKTLIKYSDQYKEPDPINENSMYNKLFTWLTSIQHKISVEEYKKFIEITKDIDNK